MRIPPRREALRLLLALCLALAPGCTSFRMADQFGALPIPRHRRAIDARCVVLPFERGAHAEHLSAADLERWQELLAMGLDQSNLFASVVAARTLDPATADFSLSGRLDRFRFRKNWVPMFFPLYLGLTFFTFSAYALVGGPTTLTHVQFAVDLELRDVRTGSALRSFSETHQSTRFLNAYTSTVDNPYENPNGLFGSVIDALATRIAAALPTSLEAASGNAPARGPAEPQ